MINYTVPNGINMFNYICSRTFNTLKKTISLQNLRSFDSAMKIHSGVCLSYPRRISKSNNTLAPTIGSRYDGRNAEKSPYMEAENLPYSDDKSKYPLLSDEYDGINLERGVTGVFDIEDLVELLNRENSKDIFVATVPKEINYVDYICVVTARSRRHVSALAEFVKKVYKKKRHATDEVPRIEGKHSDEWIAIDLGNIAFHIFSEKTRLIYDLETLWSVGPEFDEQVKKKNDMVEIFTNYSAYLKDLKPLGPRLTMGNAKWVLPLLRNYDLAR